MPAPPAVRALKRLEPPMERHDIPTAHDASCWWVRHAPRPSAAARLFCFAHAGGAAWTFRNWAARLPGTVELCAVELPGHGNRIREKPLAEFDALLEQLLAALRPELDRPFALFGHSLGALLAFETARALQADSEAVPLVHVFVSGHNAPQLPDDDLDGISQREDHELLKELRQLNCTPNAALRNAELMQLMLPVIRADFAVCESYRYREIGKLECPLTVYAGLEDPRTDELGLQAWRAHTKAQFTLRYLPGDHFFVATQEEAIVRLIRSSLCV